MEQRKKKFPLWLAFAVGLTILTILLTPMQSALAWIGFLVAAYSTMANDSIQTLGTFLSSHSKTPWWLLWSVFGTVLVIMLCYGWVIDAGSLGFGRLAKIPVPQQLSYLDVMAPIALLVLTQLRIPVSTTFLILSMFSNDVIINEMLIKSCGGYLLAFIAAMALWGIGIWLSQRRKYANYNVRAWGAAQWIATIILWSYWLMHDTANMVVYLPRQLDLTSLLIVLAVVFSLFGYIMYKRGTGIQEIVREKTDSQDIRAATIIDVTFAVILIFFKHYSNIPMSTTWVFLGVLGGRECILRRDRIALRMIVNDIGKASLGVVVSLLMVSLSRVV